MRIVLVRLAPGRSHNASLRQLLLPIGLPHLAVSFLSQRNMYTSARLVAILIVLFCFAPAASSYANDTDAATTSPDDASEMSGGLLSTPPFAPGANPPQLRASLPPNALSFAFDGLPELPVCGGNLGEDVCTLRSTFPFVVSGQPGPYLPDVNLGMVILTLKAVAAFRTHTHRVAELYYVLEGVAQFSVWAEIDYGSVETAKLAKGGVQFVPAAAPHGFKCVEPPCEIMSFFPSAEPGGYPSGSTEVYSL